MTIRTAIAGAALIAGVLTPTRSALCQPHGGDGFLFGAPAATITLHGGLARPNEGSDIFSFVRNQLTLNRGDFTGGSYGADISFVVAPRWAVQVGFATSGQTVPTNYRDYVDNARAEITQSSTLRRTPLSAGVRYYLTPTGRSLGSLAWVPSRMTAYASAGVGITWYRFKQWGDFVDYQTMDVFPATLNSSGNTASQYAALGAEYTLSPSFALNVETRYDHARGTPGASFSGFDKIDLSGMAFSMGLSVRY